MTEQLTFGAPVAEQLPEHVVAVGFWAGSASSTRTLNCGTVFQLKSNLRGTYQQLM